MGWYGMLGLIPCPKDCNGMGYFKVTDFKFQHVISMLRLSNWLVGEVFKSTVLAWGINTSLAGQWVYSMPLHQYPIPWENFFSQGGPNRLYIIVVYHIGTVE